MQRPRHPATLCPPCSHSRSWGFNSIVLALEVLEPSRASPPGPLRPRGCSVLEPTRVCVPSLPRQLSLGDTMLCVQVPGKGSVSFWTHLYINRILDSLLLQRKTLVKRQRALTQALPTGTALRPHQATPSRSPPGAPFCHIASLNVPWPV